VALVLAVAVASVGPVPVAEAARAVGPADGDGDVDKAKDLYTKGKAKYDTFDYYGAIELWTEAYSIVPEDAATTRNLLVYNIATAQEKAYDIDHDVAHLKTALLLLQTYVANFKALHGATPEARAEVQKAEDRIASLQARIAEHEGAAAPAATTTTAPPPEPVTPAEPSDDEDDEPEVSAGKGMIAGGWASVGVGAGFLLASGISFGVSRVAQGTATIVANADGSTTVEESPTARRARIAGWVLLGMGAAGIVAGAVLLPLGYIKRNKAKRGVASFVPYGDPTGGGAVMTIRF
jgi:hypothetical protein